MKKVYAVFKNADMTEGNGPMLLDRVFANRRHAEKYIDEQPGVMGIQRKWSEIKSSSHWRVTEFDVIEEDIIEKEHQEKLEADIALSKLSRKELELLQKYHNLTDCE